MSEPARLGPPPGLTVRGLTVRAGQAVLVDDADLDVPLGAVTALIGPNGAGKTTLLRGLAGLARLSSGSVWLGGLDLTAAAPRPRARQLAFVDAEEEPHAHLDLGARVELAGRLRDLAASGLAIVAAVHDLSFAASAADRVVALARGRVVAAGPTAEVLTAGLIERVYGLPRQMIWPGGVPNPQPYSACTSQSVTLTRGMPS